MAATRGPVVLAAGGGGGRGSQTARRYEARFLSGFLAGMFADRIGYVAALEIPEVVRGINAFAIGARRSNPNATVEAY